MVPFHGKGILFAFPARLFAVKFVFSAATRISVSNAPPRVLGHRCRFALLTIHALVPPCLRSKCVGQLSCHALLRQ